MNGQFRKTSRNINNLGWYWKRGGERFLKMENSIPFFYIFPSTSTQFRRIQGWVEKGMWKPRECFTMTHSLCIYCHGHHSVSHHTTRPSPSLFTTTIFLAGSYFSLLLGPPCYDWTFKYTSEKNDIFCVQSNNS